MILSHRVPFLLVGGYNAGGYSGDTPEKCVQLCEKFSIIKDDLPEEGFEKAAQDLIQSEIFQKLYLTADGRNEAAQMILAQAVRTNSEPPTTGQGTITISITPDPTPQSKNKPK